jgi:predicted dehydrogenase
MGELRVALVGCGLISEAHLRGYARHRDRARVTVFFDFDAGRARAAAAPLDGRVADSYGAILDDPEVDAVELCTPPHLHTEQVLAALRAGKHVSCQKPLARTLDECATMATAAEEAGKTLFYAEIMRTMSAAVRAAEVVAKGGIGTLVGIQATYAHWQGGEYLNTPWRYDPKVAGGGQLLDGGIHHLDLMLSIGGEVASVGCFIHQVRPELGGEDTAVVNLRYRGGHLGTLMSTQAAGTWFPGPSFVAYGTRGILTLGGPFGALVRHSPEGREVLMEERPDPFAEMVGHYLDVVLDDAPSRSTAGVAYADLRVVLAAYQSAAEGREIHLPTL